MILLYYYINSILISKLCTSFSQNLEFLLPVGGMNSKVEKEYQYYKFLLTPQQVLEAVKNYSGLPTEVAQWAVINM